MSKQIEELDQLIYDWIYDNIESELDNDTMSRNVWVYGENGTQTATVWKEHVFGTLKATILALKQQWQLEARIDELKQLEPPEQYEDYAKIMGSESCTICGFNAIVFRKYIADRISSLTQSDKEQS